MFVNGGSGEVVEDEALCSVGGALYSLSGVAGDEVEGGLWSGRRGNRGRAWIDLFRWGWVEGFGCAVDYEGSDESFAFFELRGSDGGVRDRGGCDAELACG